MRGGRLTREQSIAKVYPAERAFFALAERSLDVADIDASNLARALFEQHQHFSRFGSECG